MKTTSQASLKSYNINNQNKKKTQGAVNLHSESSQEVKLYSCSIYHLFLFKTKRHATRKLISNVKHRRGEVKKNIMAPGNRFYAAQSPTTIDQLNKRTLKRTLKMICSETTALHF